MRRPFSKIEDSLEFIVERPFSMLFRRSVQPAEIGKRLKRELTAGAIVTVRGKVAPNDFLVTLAPSDFGPYQEHANVLESDLAEWLEEIAQSQQLKTMGPMRVQFLQDDSVRPRRFDVRASIEEPEEGHFRYEDPGMTEPFEIAGRPQTGPQGYIEICSGPTTGAVFPIRKQLVSIGRDLSNDLVIESPEVSRFHAELQSYGGTVSLVDRNSMNGSFVNGVQVAGAQMIGPGDQIVFGTTICRFWRDLL